MAPTDDISLDNKNTIIFNSTKQEIFTLNENFKIFQRKLKLQAKVIINKEEITENTLRNCLVFILAAPQITFEESEINIMQNYIESGGRMLILLTEGNPADTCNINILLEHFGIIPNIDCIIRTHYFKYFHPKECYISDSQITTVLNKGKLDIRFVYPFGCTLSVSKPSISAFTSGLASFPIDRPIGALYYNEKSGGRLVAVGSSHIFSDKYLDHENNDKLRELIMDFLMGQEKVPIPSTDYDDIDIIDHHIVPETAMLAEKPKLCLSDAVSHTVVDYSKLFDHKMYSINTMLVPDSIKLYEDLGIKHEPLKIITPKFEAPYPPLQPAVFPPSFKDLPQPPLELFDLDDAFSSVFTNLAQFTNNFMMNENESDEKIEMYIVECSKILNLEDIDDALGILYKIGSEITDFKSIETIK
ncbi:intraflagellar transport protein 52 homolog isoform X1 [Diorhabda sublineata]|uniref:intraflagellar transport protein 52 homolog isoform X1 n=2 Tax=Diorhabda sublineata TaxID=1163346 RepID=UPI0024E18FA4|nr:intraflagellar transport protein 52 homolog isoform X1 [Diorhabda sublineata]